MTHRPKLVYNDALSTALKRSPDKPGEKDSHSGSVALALFDRSTDNR